MQYVSKWFNVFEPNFFDIFVTIDNIEHIKDIRFFKGTFLLTPRAIITTPNKNRDEQSAKASPPKYKPHVREWDSGEFYWILKIFFKDIKLYAMPDVYLPKYIPINIIS